MKCAEINMFYSRDLNGRSGNELRGCMAVVCSPAPAGDCVEVRG